MLSKIRLFYLFIFYIFILVVWEHPYLSPLKILVVFLHEMSHALGALMTGGTVESIEISWDESGNTITRGGSFLIIAISGYIGSIFWGSLMLYSSFQTKFVRRFTIFLACMVSYFLYTYGTKIPVNMVFFSFFWSILLILTAIFSLRMNSFLLFMMGSLTTLYGVFDLLDFIRILDTDAGKIANYYIMNPSLRLMFAYTIAFFISTASIWILIKFILYGLRHPETSIFFNNVNIKRRPTEKVATFNDIMTFVANKRTVRSSQGVMNTSYTSLYKR